MGKIDDSTAAVRALARVSRVLEQACADLGLAQYRVLAAIADGDERASGVARRLALGKPTVSASVDTLCRRGLLIRSDAASDGRAVTLRLTDSGARVLRETEAAMRARLNAMVGYTDSPADTTRALAALGGAVDQLVAERIRATR